MKFLILTFFWCSLFIVYGQSPQNVSVETGPSQSLWSSKTGIAIFFAFVILLIVGRSWSKRIHKKRDEVSMKDK